MSEPDADSDVVAWKLAEVRNSHTPENADGAFLNIYVVDDLGNPIKYYASNQFDVFNRRDISTV
jgi:hypothetical protein